MSLIGNKMHIVRYVYHFSGHFAVNSILFSFISGSCNPMTALSCGDYTCIPLPYQCDGTPHCLSGDDEKNCMEPTTCQEWWNAGYRQSGVYKIRKNLNDP